MSAVVFSFTTTSGKQSCTSQQSYPESELENSTPSMAAAAHEGVSGQLRDGIKDIVILKPTEMKIPQSVNKAFPQILLGNGEKKLTYHLPAQHPRRLTMSDLQQYFDLALHLLSENLNRAQKKYQVQVWKEEVQVVTRQVHDNQQKTLYMLF